MPSRRVLGVPLAAALAATACANAAGGGPPADGGDVDARPDAEPPARPNVLYVSVAGADSNPGDDPARPMRLLATGLRRAAACLSRCRLHVAEGVYEEALTLEDGVDLIGGWSPDFAHHDAATYPVVITSSEPRTVIADGLHAQTRLDGLTIRGADLSERGEGATSYALWVRDSGPSLELHRVAVEAGRGGRGRDGGDGTLTSCTSLGGSGGTAYDCGGRDGLVGHAGGDPDGGGGGGGFGGSNCPDACPLVGADGIGDGRAGDNGANGGDGASGAPADDADGGFADDLWLGAAGASGARGGHGTGGGGGGSGGTKRFRACFSCGSLLGGRGGDGASGGCGGNGGEAGAPGGAAIGIAVIRSQILHEVLGVSGGVGGRGGDGGDGHPGSPGGTDGSLGREARRSQTCGLITYYAGAGGAGGIGGHGGHGGGGPGGVGGTAVGVALVEGGQLQENEPGGFQTLVGSAGTGGAGGTGLTQAPAGLPGAAADVLTY